MKERTENKLRQFSLFYDQLIDEKKCKQDSEAHALGVDQSTIQKYTNPDQQSNFPAGLISSSLVGKEIITGIAEEMNLTVIDGKHSLNGSTKDEQAKVLRAIAKMTEGCNEACEIKQWKIIREQAHEALKELGK